MRNWKSCKGNRGRLWHQYEESTNNTHRGSSKSIGTYGTRLTTFTLERGQRREDWLEWSLKGQFSEHHVFDTGIIVEIVTYRDTTGTSRTSRTSRTSFSLKDSQNHFDKGKWPYCSQNRNDLVVQIHIVSLLGFPVERMLLKMLLVLIHLVLIISNDMRQHKESFWANVWLFIAVSKPPLTVWGGWWSLTSTGKNSFTVWIRIFSTYNPLPCRCASSSLPS